MSILITGGLGFIGLHTAKAFLDAGHDVVCTQFSVRRERVAEVRRSLANYQKLKRAIEAICELNHDLLRPDASAKSRSKKHD